MDVTPTASGRRAHASPLRQFQLDAAIAPEGFLGVAGIDRLGLAKACRNQPLRRDTFADQILDDWISQVNGRALALSTVAQGLRTTGDVMLCPMFGDRRRIERFNS